ncbi:MAG: universal stress protein, partial [Williamsia herbipolensis]|nr:universal stress protein [Williamsia herbipolensis]
MTNSSIVVGVGDDSAARGALDWAAAEALARGTGLELVRAFHFTPGVEPWGPVAADGLITDSLHRAAERRLSRAARYLASTVPGLPTTSVAVDGIAWDVLIDRSREGALVVLGSRRLSAGRAVALGSVSTVVAAKAPGPVV